MAKHKPPVKVGGYVVGTITDSQITDTGLVVTIRMDESPIAKRVWQHLTDAELSFSYPWRSLGDDT